MKFWDASAHRAAAGCRDHDAISAGARKARFGMLVWWGSQVECASAWLGSSAPLARWKASRFAFDRLKQLAGGGTRSNPARSYARTPCGFFAFIRCGRPMRFSLRRPSLQPNAVRRRLRSSRSTTVSPMRREGRFRTDRRHRGLRRRGTSARLSEPESCARAARTTYSSSRRCSRLRRAGAGANAAPVVASRRRRSAAERGEEDGMTDGENYPRDMIGYGRTPRSPTGRKTRASPCSSSSITRRAARTTSCTATPRPKPSYPRSLAPRPGRACGI